MKMIGVKIKNLKKDEHEQEQRENANSGEEHFEKGQF